MRNLAFLLFITVTAASLSSCSLMRDWGLLSTKDLQLIETRRHEAPDGRVYRFRKYLVSESPRETITEVTQITEAWADR